MNKQTLNVCILSLLTLSCEQIAAHDPRVDQGEDQTALPGCLLEASGNENSTPELPTHVLEFLYDQLGLMHPAVTNENGNPIADRPLTGLTTLPPEIMSSICRCNPKIISKIAQQLGSLELMTLTGSEGRPLTCTEIKFSPNGTYIAVKDSDNHFHLCNDQGNFVRTLVGSDGNSLSCRWITFSPYETYIAAIDTNWHSHLFDRQGNFVRTLYGSDGNPLSGTELKFSPYETYIAARDRGGDWHLFHSQGNLVRTLITADNTPLTCTQIIFSPYETYIAARDRGGEWHLFDCQCNLMALNGPDGNPLSCTDLEFSPHEAYFAAWDTTHYHLFDCQCNLMTLNGPDGIPLSCTGLKFSPHETYIAAWDKNRHYHLFDGQGNFIRTLNGSDGNPLSCRRITFSPHETYIAAEDTNHVWHLFDDQGNFVRTLNGSDGNPLACLWLKFSPHETYIAAWDTTYHYHLFDCQGNFMALNGPDGTPLISRLIIFSPCETYVAGKDTNGHVHLYHNRLVKELRGGISPNQFLLLRLLASLTEGWEHDHPGVPFATCPTDITCTLLNQLLTLEDFRPETAAQTKELVRAVHTWVLYTLGSFTPASYDTIRKSCNLENDPVIRHREYEDNGLIAPKHLAAYVRLKNMQLHTQMLERIDKNEEALQRAYEESQEELSRRRASYDQIEKAPGFFDHDDDNEGDENNELFSASFLLEID